MFAPHCAARRLSLAGGFVSFWRCWHRMWHLGYLIVLLAVSPFTFFSGVKTASGGSYTAQPLLPCYNL